jgi:hypothetical protein
MILCLCGSVDQPLILCADSVPIPKWWVDGSHAMHPNMRGHSGGCMSLGKITLIEQKINARSSAKTEKVAADDFVPIILWTDCFLKVQGHGHKEGTTLPCQDKTKVHLSSKLTVANPAAREPNMSMFDMLFHHRLHQQQ